MLLKPAFKNKRRSRRLRKKLRIGEFRQDGFTVEFAFAPTLSSEAKNDLLFAFIRAVIEPRKLLFGGGESAFVTGAGRRSATEADREAARAWLQAADAVSAVVVGHLEDAWAKEKA